MGKVFPVPGLRKVDGNLGWSRAQGEGAGPWRLLSLCPAPGKGCGELGEGMPGLFVLASRWLGYCVPRPGAAWLSWYCGRFQVSAMKP